MSTMGDLIDRTLRHLMPADDQPTQTTLTTTVDTDDTEWIYTGSALTVDEEELFTVGVIVEIGLEQAVITDADHTTNTLTVRRAVNGTTAAEHTAGDVITLAPVFPRKDVFDALADNLVALFPALYRRTTDTITITTGHTIVDADARIAEGLRYARGTRYYDGDVSLIQNFTPSATTNAIITNAPTGATAYFTYRGKFPRPTQESDDLQTVCGVEESWERIVMVGAVAQLLTMRESDSLNVEFVTEQMRAEGYPAGTSSRLRSQLLQYHQFLLDQARRQQLASNAEIVAVNSPVAAGGY